MYEKVLFSAELKNMGISEYNEVIRNLWTLLKDLQIEKSQNLSFWNISSVLAHNNIISVQRVAFYIFFEIFFRVFLRIIDWE